MLDSGPEPRYSHFCAIFGSRRRRCRWGKAGRPTPRWGYGGHLFGRAMSTQIASPVRSGLPEGLAEHRLLTSDEAALLLGVPVATLRTWRSRRRGYGPRAVQVGGSIRYRLADLLAWIEDHTENADGNVAEGIEPSKRGKTSPADLPPITRQRRPGRTTGSGRAAVQGSATAR